MIPYSRQCIEEDDVAAVVEVLRSDWLTTGPKVPAFEEAFAETVGAKHAVAVSSGTAALHAAMHAMGVGPGDEVIVPAITFAATANCVVFQGGTPVFADVEADTLLIDPADVEAKIGRRTRAIIAVDYAGQPSNYDKLRQIADQHGLALVADACHALGARYKGRPVGSLTALSTFSFHPVKHITTGEGGMISTDDFDAAEQIRKFRNHGIGGDHRERALRGSWYYEMVDLGFNYRMTDFQAALGMNQLKKLPRWVSRRREVAAQYDVAFEENSLIHPLAVRADVFHSYHLYVVRLGDSERVPDRTRVFTAMRDRGIGVNVHYIPVHLHPYYRERFRTGPGLCPAAEKAYEGLLSLPVYPGMSDEEVTWVADSLISACRED